MSSMWPSALVSLDDSLALYCESLENLEAAKSVDIAEVIEQLRTAAESAENVRALISTELPDASWQSRQELDGLVEEIQKRVEARRIEEQRSRLLALAAALERGSVVHRRAMRVTELHRLRDLAIEELRSQAGSEAAPLTLPGPEADQWIEWASGLQEPEDAESIQALRGFAHLDDFVANLEPNMWVTKMPQGSWQNREELEKLIEFEAKAQEERRSRLLALATELEGGSVVHHRAQRVTELNQLRDQAIKELRSQAGSEATPLTLPGPEANQWVEWACGLQEPDDAESIQALRNGFPHLDDFVAKLEPDMWIAAGLPAVETPPELDRSAGKTHLEQSRREINGFEETVLSSGPIPIRVKAAKSLVVGRDEPQVSHPVDRSSRLALADTLAPSYVAPPQIEEEEEEEALPPEQKRPLLTSIRSLVAEPVRRFNHLAESTFTTDGFTSDVDSEEEEPWWWKKRKLLATAAVVLLAVLGIILWRSHRNHAGDSTVKAVERIPVVTASNAGSQPGTIPDSLSHPPGSQPQTDKQSKPTDQSGAAKPVSPTPPVRQASNLDNGEMRLPTAIPKNSASGAKDEAPPNSATEVPGSVPGGVPGGAPNSVANIVRDIPIAQPKISTQKIKVSSGVAQALLVHQVAPRYPDPARKAGIEGTVVLQAVIGKDGSVQNVHALRGNSLLIQAAVDAVKQWRYKPYNVGGDPVEADTQINVNFKLH